MSLNRSMDVPLESLEPESTAASSFDKLLFSWCPPRVEGPLRWLLAEGCCWAWLLLLEFSKLQRPLIVPLLFPPTVFFVRGCPGLDRTRSGLVSIGTKGSGRLELFPVILTAAWIIETKKKIKILKFYSLNIDFNYSPLSPHKFQSW